MIFPVVRWGPKQTTQYGIGVSRELIINNKGVGFFDAWIEDRSLKSVDEALQALARAGCMHYERVDKEWK